MPASASHHIRTVALLFLSLLLLTGLLPAVAQAQVTAGAATITFSGQENVVTGAPSRVDVTVQVTNPGTLREDTPLRLVGDLGDGAAGAVVAHVREGATDELAVDDGTFVFPREDRAPLTLGGSPALLSAEGLTVTLELTLPTADAAELSVTLAASNERSATVIRRSGPERVATAAAISAATFNPGVPVAYIARSDAFPDALAGGPSAGLGASPILLTLTGSLPQVTADELDRLQPQRIVVLGGPSAIADVVLTALADHTEGTVTRLSGANRFATAAAIALDRYPDTVETVLIATGENFADALSGGPRAAVDDAPILLVGGEVLPDETIAALESLTPQRIIVLGGPGAVSDAVAGALASYASAGVTRISGPTRFETSAAISRATFPAGGVSTAYLATGLRFPDSLAGAPAAIVDGGPLLLVTADTIPQAVATELQRLQPGVVVILGGTGVVSVAVADAVALLTRDIEPDRARFTPVGVPATTTVTPSASLTIDPLSATGPAALRPGDRFVLTFTAPNGGGDYVVERRAAGSQAWVPFINPTASGQATAGTNSVPLNAPVDFADYDVRVRLTDGPRSQTAVLANALTVALRFRPPMFGSLVEGVADQSQVIAVSPIRGLEEGVQLDANLSDGVRAGIDYSDAELTLLHGTGEARIVRNRPPDFELGIPGCLLCIEYIAGDGDLYTEGTPARPAPIIAFRLDGVDAPDINDTFIGRFFRYDDLHGVQWVYSVGTPGAVASAQLTDLEQGNFHQPQFLSFAIPGAPAQQALAPGEQVIVDLSEAQAGAVDYSFASAFVQGGGHHGGFEAEHDEPEPEPALGTAEIEVEGDSAILTFTAGADGVPSVSPEGPVISIFIGGVEVEDESARYTATLTRSDSPAVSTASFATRLARVVDVSASDLAAADDDQTQTFTATIVGDLPENEAVIVDLFGAQNGAVDYRNAEVTVEGGTGEVEVFTFEEDFHGSGAALIYLSGGDDDGTTLTLTATGVATEDADETHFAEFFRTDGGSAVSAAFDVGEGSAFISPFVSDVESGSDFAYQFIGVGLRDELAAGQTMTIDLSAAEQGLVGYAGAAAEVLNADATASLDVVEDTSATLTITAGEDGAAAGSRIFIDVFGVATDSGEASYDVPFARDGDDRIATARFAVRRVPSVIDVSASSLESATLGQTQTLKATVAVDMSPDEVVKIDLSGAERGAALYGGAIVEVTNGSGTATLSAFAGNFASIRYQPGPEGDADGTELELTIAGVNTTAADETHAADFARFREFGEFSEIGHRGELGGRSVSPAFFGSSQRSALFDIGDGSPFVGEPFITDLFAGGFDDYQFAEVRLSDPLAPGEEVVVDLSAAQAGVVDYSDAAVAFVSGGGTAALDVVGDSATVTYTAGAAGVRAGTRIFFELFGVRTEQEEAAYPVTFTAPGGTATTTMRVFVGGHGGGGHGFGAASAGADRGDAAPRRTRSPMAALRQEQ